MTGKDCTGQGFLSACLGKGKEEETLVSGTYLHLQELFPVAVRMVGGAVN